MSASQPESLSRSDIVFTEKDRALKEDVHWLGQLVGELVREQAGEALFDLVEAARRAAIAHRSGDATGLGELDGILATLEPNSARDFIRAFSTYFQIVNMAEKVHRIRRRRAYLKDESQHQPFSFLDILERLRDAGLDAAQVESAVSTLGVEPVFTAHLAEATRRTLLRKQQSIARHLVQLLDPYMTPQETAATIGQIRLEMTTSWQTEEHPTERRLSDQAEHVLFFLTDVLYRMIPPLYESLEAAFMQIWPEVNRRVDLPVFVRFSSWVGGDMDGNPAVTAKSIRETLSRQRALILDLYHRECGELVRHLSQTEGRCEFSGALTTQIARYKGHFPRAAHSIHIRHSRMPYRIFLHLVRARLQATFDDTAFPYEHPDEFIADIEIIGDSLRANKGHNAGLFAIRRLLRRIRTFGFHLATLDLRQSALSHRQVVGEALEERDWLDQDSVTRTARIKVAFERRESPTGEIPSDARRMFSVFQTIAHSNRRYGPHGLGSYIVSGIRGADDVLSILLLARWGHLGPKRGAIPIDIAPLFESAEELAKASEIMENLLTDEIYREHLRNRSDQQVVVLGYSGGNRDGDVLSTRWNVDKAQCELGSLMRRFGVELTIAHARGGSMNHASGRVDKALDALPRDIVSSRLRMTEQGETINAKYGLRGIAMRTLEQLTSALLWARARPVDREDDRRRWSGLMYAMTRASSAAYRSLVFDSPKFDEYFLTATPIDVIERLDIGPSGEAISMSPSPVEGIHEIFWGFAWTQSRFYLPAWYGFASGIEEGIGRFGFDAIQEFFANSDFFQLLVADVEVTLAKADLVTAERYSALAGRLHQQFFPRIRAEFEASVDVVLRLTGQSTLLQSSPTLARSIPLRNPYVDPMNLLQIDLLERWRASDRNDDTVLQALFASVNGIAHAMQDAG
jgi:phosphoenolpyruvate carboxylase